MVDDGGLGDFEVFGAGARAGANAADHVTIDDNRQASIEVGVAAAARHRQLGAELVGHAAGLHPCRHGGARFRYRSVDAVNLGAVHAHESEQIAAIVDHRDTHRRVVLFGLGDRGIEQLACAFLGQLEVRNDVGHGGFPP